MTVTVSGHAGTDVSVAPSTLTFISDNWNAAQTVTVRAAQDDDAAADGTVTLAHAVSSVDDADYNSVTADSVAVTIDEEDTAGVSIAPTALTVLEGQSNSYKVVLNTQPTAAVVVTVGGHVGTELSLSGETLVSDALTFTGQNWGTPQTVTLTAGSVSANTQVTLNHFVVGGDYGSLTVKGVNVTIVDSPEEREIIQVGVTESEQSLAVLEGGSNVYEVVLSESPTGDVTVTVTVEDAANNDITTKEASLVFTSENWNLPQTVTVRAAHDDDALQDPVVQISHGVSGANFADRTIPGVAVTITEDDFPRVTVVPQFLEILEGSSGRYTVVLTTRPSGEVTITIGGHADTDITLSDTTLTFTSENWDTPLEVTVSAAQDDDATADPAVTLKHTVEGGGYQGVVAWSVTVTITEDDTAGVSIDSTALTVPEGDNGAYTVKLNTQPSGEVIIDITGGGDVTVSPTSLTFTTVDWSTAQKVTVSVDQDDDAANDTQAVSHAVGDGSAAEYIGATIDDVQVTVTDDDAAGVSIDPTALTVVEGQSNAYTVVLTSQPSADVTVTVSGHDGTDLSLSGQTLTNDELTFTPDNWNQPQTVTVSAAQDEDAAADPAVTLSHAVSGAVEYAAVSAEDIPSVTVTIDEDDAAGVSIDPKTLTVPEGGDSSYTVVLDTQPTAEVAVTINGHDGTDVSVDKTSLTFASENWGTAQTVTVNAAQDADAAPDEAVTLSHTVSGADEYQTVNSGSVTVTITDDDMAGVSIDPTELTVTEGDATGAYTVVLDTQPTADVTITITGHAGTDVTLSKDSLTFTADNWETPQTVTVSAAQDDDAAADAAVTLSHTVNGTGEYAPVTAASVTVTIVDEDTSTLSVSAARAAEDAGYVVFEVDISAANDQEVTVNYATSDDTATEGQDYTETSGALIFPANSVASQTISVPVLDDTMDEEEEETFILTLSQGLVAVLAGGGETLAATGTITDNDDPQVTVSFGHSSYTVTEGSAVEVTVTLSADPEREVTIPINETENGASSDDYSVAPGSLSFASGETSKSFTFTANDDRIDDDGESVDLAFGTLPDGVSTSGVTPSATVTITDDDMAGVSIDPTELTVTEGDPGGASYTVVLDTQPTAEVTVTVSGHAGTDVTLDKTSLTFTSENWGTAQTVTVSAGQDDDAAADEAVILSHAVSGAVEYAAVSAEDIPIVTVTIDEDDAAGVSINPTTLTVPEGGDNSYTVVLDTQPSAEVTVTISGHAGTAIAPSNDSLTFSPSNWNIAQTVTLTAGEVDVTTELTLSHEVTGSGEYGTITADDVNVTVLAISDNQDPNQMGVTVSFPDEDHAVREGTGNADVGLVLSAALESAAAIPIIVSSQSTAGVGDYSGVPTTATFAQGETSTSFPVQLLVDLEDEDDERVVLGLGTLPDGISAGDVTQATVTILDAVRVSFGASSYEATEGGADAVVTVQLNEPAPHDMNVPLTAAGRNGADESDWSGVPENVVFNTGDTSKFFTVVAVDDTVEDDDEMVELGFGTLPGGLIAVSPATATLTIMNQEEEQPTQNDCDSAIWCATLTFGETDRKPFMYENGLFRSYDWGGRWDHWGRSEGANLTNNKFTYDGTEYTISGISTSPAVPFPQLSKFFLGFDEYGTIPTEDHYSQWTLYVDDVALPFSPERIIPPNWFKWRHPKTYLIEPVTTVELRIEANVELEPESRLPARYLSVLPENVTATSSGLRLLWEWPSFDGAEDVVFQNPPGLTGYKVQWKEADDSWDESDSELFGHTAAITTWISHILDLTEDVEYAVRVIAVYEDGDSEPTEEVIVTVRETTPPEISAAVVVGAMLTLTYDEALDEDSKPATEAFSVKAGGEVRATDAVSVDGSAVTLTLASAVTAEDTVTLNYIDKLEVFVSQRQAEGINRAKTFVLDGADNHTAAFVRDVAGNDASAFLDLPVTNNTPSTAGLLTREVVENPPPAPKNLTATVNADGSVTLNWEAPDDDSITDYRVSRQQTDEDEGTSLTTVMDTGSTADTFTDTATAAGVSYTYFVQAINEAGLSDESNYALIALPQPPAPGQNTLATGLPTITGTLQVGETLTADTSAIADADGLTIVSYSYQWMADDTNIQGATDPTYTLTEDEEGKAIKVTVSFTDDANNEESLPSAPTDAVAAAPAQNTQATGAPTISGTAQVGQTLTADTSGIADEDGLTSVSYRYQWVADDTNIQGATDATYILTEDDEGKTLKVEVSFTDDGGNEESLTSVATGEVAPEAGPGPLTGFTLVDTSGPYQEILWEHWRNGSTLTLDYPASGSYGIRVDTKSGEEIGSVRLELTGEKNVGRTEGAAPYSLYGDEGEDELNGEGLPAGDYNLKATASSKDGNVLGTLTVSFTVEATVEPLPGRPQDLKGKVSEGGIELTWTAPVGSAVVEYVVYRGTLQNGSMNGQALSKHATIDAAGKAMTYTDDNVEEGVEYRYRVAAVNTNGEGKKSNWLDITAEHSSP